MTVIAPDGFVAAGLHCGVKPSGVPDLALVATDDGRAVPAAGVFTTNLTTAAPVLVSREHLDATGGRAAAVVLNSGNANAATGDPGRLDAERMCAATATAIGCERADVLVCSTGLIGYRLPIDDIEAGIAKAAAALDRAGGGDAAEAIRTTDTVRKEAFVAGDGFTVGGMAKGAAMLAPDLATMLAVLTTDAVAEPAALRAALLHATANSFGALTVDGCTSTNDTVLVLASGRGATPSDDALTGALTAACQDLAEQMAADAEGATKVVRVRVKGAATDEDARRVARKIADSQLVKCSFYGEDPYWGRVASEVGSAGAHVDPDRLSIAYGGVVVAADGVAAAHDAAAVAAHLAGRHVEVTAHLGLGTGTAAMLTTDLTHAYIDENMRTS